MTVTANQVLRPKGPQIERITDNLVTEEQAAA